MSKIALSGDASGTGTFTIASPNTNSNYTLTLPANSGTLISTSSTGQVIPKAALPTGSVLQVVSANYGVVTTSTNPTVASYSTGLSASITPTSSSSKVLVMFTNQIWIQATSTGTYYGHMILYKNGSALVDFGVAEFVYGAAMTEIGFRASEIYLDSPATTSAVTYSTYFYLDSAITSGSLVRNRNGAPGVMILMEIAA